MKAKKIITVAALMVSATALANHPDSVYVRPDINDGEHSMFIAYSTDRKHWKRVNTALFDGDYGAWGSQKKIFYPVLSYDGRVFHASFFPDPDYLTNNAQNMQRVGRYGQIAVTESRDMRLWKPQEYPFVPEQEYRERLAEQKRASAENVITVPYSTIKGLLHTAERNALYGQWESENYVATAQPIADHADSIMLHMTIDADDSKEISPSLVGVFFEDISYAADGGLYAELIQNRDFEYSAEDHRDWNALTAWQLKGEGSTIRIETEGGISKNNPHYAVISTQTTGARLVNSGWDGIPVKAGGKYLLSLFAKGKGRMRVSLVAGGTTVGETVVGVTDKWQQKKSVITATADAADAQLVIEPLQAGEMCVDFVSLFPKDTFKGHANGLRKDLAQTIADIHPRFIRFPGGCATHGNGIDNIYHWKASVGELWDRKPDSNIWHYHQSRGLGFYEYFQYCEDIGAEPLPVLAAGVPCQNSSHGGNGQNGGIPWARELSDSAKAKGDVLTMESYLQDLIDLIEWANGDAKTSKWAAMRAKAGHAKPFNMKYLGIGNEDLISDVFMERYLYLIDGIKKVHPEITVVGTAGPFWQGSDYEYGWRAAKEHSIEMVDEHYYNSPGWYFHHRDFYDNYDRGDGKTAVYLGEWASKGTMTSNALIEAAYMTNLERNADVVRMSSYAPLLAKDGHTNWNPSLIYFDNQSIRPTANYYVQRLFGENAGDRYVYSDVTVDYKDTAAKKGGKPMLGDIKARIDKSVVVDSKTGDVIIKIVSLLPKASVMDVDIPESLRGKKATVTTLAQPASPDRSRGWEVNGSREISVSGTVRIEVPAWSVSVIRMCGVR